MVKPYETVSIKKLPGSEVEITGAISAEVFDSFRKKALKNINENIKMDGFRKGNIPEKVLASKVGEKTILEEMAELALGEAYPVIVNDQQLDPIGHPRIKLTKIAMGNPLEFVLSTAVMPQVTLGDYKKIAKETLSKKVEVIPVTEKEITEAIEQIRKTYAEKNVNMMEPDEHDHDHVHDDSHQHTHEHDHTHTQLHKEIDTPEFKTRIENALSEDRKREALEKKRIEIAENINASSTIELPAILLDNEMRRIENQFTDDISRMGIKLEDYLVKIKKTIEDLRAEWKPNAEKKARLQIILNTIADTEKIVANEKEVETEVAHILEHYKDVDKKKAFVYATGVLTNEKVFEFLEAQK